MFTIGESHFEEIVGADWNSDGVYTPATLYSDGDHYRYLTLKDVESDTWCTLERDYTPPKKIKSRCIQRMQINKKYSDGEQIKVKNMFFRGMYLTLCYFFSILVLKHCK